MNIVDQIYTRTLVMAGRLQPEQEALLQVLCRVVNATLESRLRSGISPEDCQEELISAGSLLALAALSEGDGRPERFTAGDLTIQHGSGSAAARCLRGQAELILMPYVRESFTFLGV